MKYTTSGVWVLSVWLFIAIKLAGHSFIAWSWWWVLFPPIPVLSLFVGRLNL